MSQQTYRRVDLDKLEDTVSSGPRPLDDGDGSAIATDRRVRWSIIPFSIGLCILQAALTIGASHNNDLYMTSTLITVLGLAVLMLIVLILNPLFRLLFRGRRLRPLNRGELTCVFASMLVTAGIATFGLADQLIPIVSSPWNPDWNTPQSGWSQTVLPHLNPKVYLTLPDDASERDKHAAGQILDTVQADLEAATPDPAADLAAIRTIRQVLRGINVKRGDLEQAIAAVTTAAGARDASHAVALGQLRPIVQLKSLWVRPVFGHGGSITSRSSSRSPGRRGPSRSDTG